MRREIDSLFRSITQKKNKKKRKPTLRGHHEMMNQQNHNILCNVVSKHGNLGKNPTKPSKKKPVKADQKLVHPDKTQQN